MAGTHTNVVTFVVDGTKYDVDLYDIDGIEWRDAKAATNMKQVEIINAALAEKDFEAVAALLWIWRRREEPSLTYGSVLSGLSYRSLIHEENGEGSPAPPDSGGHSSGVGPPSLASMG